MDFHVSSVPGFLVCHYKGILLHCLFFNILAMGVNSQGQNVQKNVIVTLSFPKFVSFLSFQQEEK